MTHGMKVEVDGMNGRNGNVLVVLGSHRAHDKLIRYLGHKPQCWYSMYYRGNLAEVPPDLLAGALTILGIRKARPKEPEKWHPCWGLGE